MRSPAATVPASPRPARAGLGSGPARRLLWALSLALCPVLLPGRVAAAPLVQAPPPPPIAAPGNEAYPGVITLAVDATDLQRRVLRVTETLPVRPGQRLTLLYARYLPGAHGPYGRVEQMAGLSISGNSGQPLRWERDTLDTFAFHVDVPADVNRLTLRFQHLSPPKSGGDRITMTRNILGVEWETTVLYPAGHRSSAIRVQPTLKLPAGWQQASALPSVRGQRPAEAAADGQVAFGEVSLETLIDSPLFAGRHLRRIELDPPGTPQPVVLNIVSDEPGQAEASPEQLAAHRALVTQAERLFGSRPWRRYDFLLALSDEFGGIGLEHHESSENGLRPDYFKHWDDAIGGRELLPHEFVHAWNGKLRRPDDLWTANYNVPMRNTLTWVYEGLTEYWGHVLAVRAGLSTPEQARDRLALGAAQYEQQAGRAWRSLQDTTNDPRLGPNTERPWPDWQRDTDYYVEGQLLWLDVDTLIREQSGGARSLDDLARSFFGVPAPRQADGAPQALPYTFDELIAALNAVQPLDWAGFLRTRLDRVGGGAPLDGLARGGWQLVWRDDPGPFQPKERGWSGPSGTERPADYGHSLGLFLLSDGAVDQVVWNSPAFQAGLVPGSTVLAVAGLAYRPERLDDAIRANRDGNHPIQLLVKDGEQYRDVRIDWRGGLRYPALERRADATTPDRLSAIYAPR